MMIRPFLSIIISIFILTACSSGLFSVHKIDIQQGNSLTETQIEKIESGMSRQAVLNVLGEPILAPVLSADRWEYFYYLKKPDVAAVRKELTIVFVEDKVASLVRK